MIIMIFVDDSLFQRMSTHMVDHLGRQSQIELKMNMVGELTYFLGSHVNRMKDKNFGSQFKYPRSSCVHPL